MLYSNLIVPKSLQLIPFLREGTILDIFRFYQNFNQRAGYPVDTRRKLNVYKTFNLRPVSTGYLAIGQFKEGFKETKKEIFRWQ